MCGAGWSPVLAAAAVGTLAAVVGSQPLECEIRDEGGSSAAAPALLLGPLHETTLIQN